MKSITLNLPLLSVIMIGIASLKNYVYFRLFGINIFDFWGAEEILTSFIDEIVMMIILGLIFIFIAIIAKLDIVNDYFPSTNHNKAKIKGEFSQEYNRDVSSIPPLLLFFLVPSVLDAIFWLFYFFNMFSRCITIACTVFSFVLAILLAVFRFGIERTNNLELKKIVLHIMLIFIGLMLIIMFGVIDYNSVRYGKINSDSTAIINGDKIEFGSKKYFIGNTKNYFFIYDQNEPSCIIYHMQDVSEFKIKYNNSPEKEGYFKQ